MRSGDFKESLINGGPGKIRVGRYTYGYERLTIHEWGEGTSLSIGSFCSIAPGVEIFMGGNHRVDWITTFPFGHVFEGELGGRGIQGNPYSNGDVVIGHDVWLGQGCKIMSGVTIGHGAVIGAHALVTKDVAPYEIWGGNPAKRIRARFTPEVTSVLLQLEWWNLPVAKIRNICELLSMAPTQSVLDKIQEIAAAEEELP